MIEDEPVNGENKALRAPVHVNVKANPIKIDLTSPMRMESNSNRKIVSIDIESNSMDSLEDTKAPVHKQLPIFHEIFLSGNMKNFQKLLMKEARDFIDYLSIYKLPTLRSFFFSVILFFDIVLRGISQVFLCNHPISGVFILVGLSFSHINYVYYSLLGTSLSTISFFLFTGNIDHSLAGLAGYDGALVGCACYSFLDSKFAFGVTVLLSILVGIIHIFCVNFLNTWKLPAFTLGFNIVTMLTLLSIRGGIVSWQLQTSSFVYDNEDFNQSWSYFLDSTFRGVGQFMFAHTTLGSFFVILGIAISSPLGAVAAMSGSIVGAFTSRHILQVNARSSIHSGLFGYNCAGVSSALATLYVNEIKNESNILFLFRNFVAIVFGSVICSLITIGVNGMLNGLPNLTIPFIVSSWIMILTESPIFIPKKL